MPDRKKSAFASVNEIHPVNITSGTTPHGRVKKSIPGNSNFHVFLRNLVLLNSPSVAVSTSVAL